MERPRVEFIDGKVLYDGRSLVAWASRVADRIVERCNASRVVLYGSVARGDDVPGVVRTAMREGTVLVAA